MTYNTEEYEVVDIDAVLRSQGSYGWIGMHNLGFEIDVANNVFVRRKPADAPVIRDH